jgi:hypothetical protein
MSALLHFDVVLGLVSLELFHYGLLGNFQRFTFFEVSVKYNTSWDEMEKVQAPYESTLCMVTGPNSKIYLILEKECFKKFLDKLLH